MSIGHEIGVQWLIGTTGTSGASIRPQWISLGTFFFKTSLPARVVLNNATGEKGEQLAADGVEFVPLY